MRRILVTGGAGFLGSHLCTRLVEDGHHVTCLDNFSTGHPDSVGHLDHERFEVVRHDIVEPYHLEVDEIYHLACCASPQHDQHSPVGTIKTAVVGTMNVLELAHRTRARILVTSSGEVYGEPELDPQREDYWGYVNPVGPRSCYDEGKRCSEALAVAYAREHGVDARIVRVFDTYGPRMHEQDGRVVSSFIAQALREQPLTIYGDGTQTRSLCYQSDLIAGLVSMMQLTSDPGPINLGNPEELSVIEIAELVLALTRSQSALEHHALPPDDPTRRRPDITKARMTLGWEPKVPVAMGMRETIEYYRSRIASVHGTGHSQLRRIVVDQGA